jgi:hypothetical protein
MFAPVLSLIEDEYLFSCQGEQYFYLSSHWLRDFNVFFGLFFQLFGHKKTILLSLIISAFAFLLVPFQGCLIGLSGDLVSFKLGILILGIGTIMASKACVFAERA